MELESTIEVEVKFAGVEPEGFRNQLRVLGAVHESSQSQTDEYFSHPSRSFRETDEALRIRSNEAGHVLTYKGPKALGTAKIRSEIEAAFPSDQQANLKKILENLGFRSLATVRKFRESWVFHTKGAKVNLEIDQVEQLGTFVEIEMLAKKGETAIAEQLILEVAARLQLAGATKSSYLALLLAQSER